MFYKTDVVYRTWEKSYSKKFTHSIESMMKFKWLILSLQGYKQHSLFGLFLYVFRFLLKLNILAQIL